MHTANKISALILDMDGVLWRDQTPIGDLPAIFSTIERRGYRVALATNNATRSVDQYLSKLAGFGVQLEAWQIVNSPQATAGYLCRSYPGGGPVYIVGEDGLVQTLAEQGYFVAEQNVIAVIAGMDRSFTYEKLKKATRFIRAGATFIATNPDRTFPTPEGLVPGAGSIVAAIEAATDVKPVVIGKPAPEMYLLALQRLNAQPAETVVIGDRLETDIVGAQAIGCRTGLVLSGVTTQQQAAEWMPAPDYVSYDLTALLELL